MANRLSNAIEASTSTNRSFGFVPVPKKFGKTTNFEIPKWMFKRELQEYKASKEKENEL